MKTKKLHMIGNAHIDPVWLWQWQEGFHEVKATFRSALDRMNEYEDFKFVASSAAFYEWVEKSDPGMFAEILERVKEGRWGLVGGWWVEPDCNIPSGESFVRHSLYGQRYFKQKFGVGARTGFNVDSFGHSATIPQILQKSGIDHYVFLRPMPHERSLPSRLFWWEAADGSRVLAFRIPFEYLSWGKGLAAHALRCAEEMKEPVDEFMCFYGVGNHGGGPTIENIESLHDLDQDTQFPTRLVCSTPEDFFAAAKKKGWAIPVVHDELQNHAKGCFSVHSGIKQWNRQAENRLQAAEKWSAVTYWQLGTPYPSDFTHAWKQVLFNQFHDILAGTSLEAAYQDSRNSFGEALAIADRNLNNAVQSLAWNIRLEYDDNIRPLVVFNSMAGPVKTNVEIESRSWPGEAVLLDDSGCVVPHQQVQSTTTTGRVRTSFNADLPALGYRTYRLLMSGDKDHKPEPVDEVKASDLVLENRRMRMEFDPKSGTIASLRDKVAGVEVFSGEAAKAVVLNDPGDTWGHDIFRWDDVDGSFTATQVRLVEHGPVKSVVRVTSVFGNSKLVQDFAMYPDSDQVDVAVVLDWREQMKMLKLRFPINVKFMKVTRNIAYGNIETFSNGEEMPFQQWVDVSGTSREREIGYGFSLLNDAKYSLDVNVRDIGMTILRSPAYAHHDPAKLDPNGHYSYIDQGIQTFHYSLVPHEGSWENAGIAARAALLNQPPVVMFGTFHPKGSLPQSASFIEVQPPQIQVTVLKRAEDNDDLIIRAVETTQAAVSGTISLPQWKRTIETSFVPGEIKTLRVPRDGAKQIVETNLLEES